MPIKSSLHDFNSAKRDEVSGARDQLVLFVSSLEDQYTQMDAGQWSTELNNILEVLSPPFLILIGLYSIKVDTLTQLLLR